MSQEIPIPHESFSARTDEQPGARLAFQAGVLARHALDDTVMYTDASPAAIVERCITYLAETEHFARIHAYDAATSDMVSVRTQLPADPHELTPSTIRADVSPEAADILNDLLSRYPKETLSGLLSRGLVEYSRASAYTSAGYDLTTETADGTRGSFSINTSSS